MILKTRHQPSQSDTKARLYREILGKIINGEFPQGQRLVEEELAEIFRVSRTPVREVLFTLEKDGLVERNHNRGARVASFTADDVEQIYNIRKVLECLSVRQAAQHLSLENLLQIESRLVDLIERRNAHWLEEQSDLDFQFHELIYSHSGNRRLVTMLENLSFLIHSLRVLSNANEEHASLAAHEHLEIVRALLQRDAERAEYLLGEHIDRAKQRVIESSFTRKQVGKEIVSNTSR